MPLISVVGGGPIGLAIAWRCAERGMTVRVYDPAAGSGASAVAAGMLAPVAEAYFGEPELTGLLAESAARWPRFAAELAAASGVDFGHRTDGTLVVGLTSDDLVEARRLWTYQQGLGLPITALRPSQLREHEPALTPRVRGGAVAPGDHQVDPRRLVDALRIAAGRAGVELVAELVHDLSGIDSEVVVVAAGCGSAALAGLPVRPVKGQILRLRAPDGGAPGFRHVIRGYVDGEHIYLVPRADGEVVLGATVEERSDLQVTAGAVLRLLRAAVDLVPELSEYDLVETVAGLRPGTPDNAPLLGPLPDPPRVTAATGRRRTLVATGPETVAATGRSGTVASTGQQRTLVATGHHRHGIVLTPVTADLIADLIATGVPDPLLAPFDPTRFSDKEDRRCV